MSEEKHRQFIKDYNKIMPFLEKVYYYGTYSVNDFIKLGMCKKSQFYYIKNTLEYVFANLIEKTKNNSNEVSLKIRNNHFENPHCAVLNFFCLKSFVSTKRFCRICYILLLLHKNKCGMTFQQIEINFSENLYFSYEDGKELSSSLRKILENMCINRIAKKIKDRYFLCDTYIYDFDEDIIDKLLLTVDICINNHPISICGNSVMKKFDVKYESPFLFKHLHLGRKFNEVNVWKLITFIQNRKLVNIEYKITDKPTPTSNLLDVIPYKIINDDISDRQYVFTIYLGEKNVEKFNLLRVDRIIDIEYVEKSIEIPSDDELEEMFENQFRYSFNGISILKCKDTPSVGTILYDKSVEYKIKQRFPECIPEIVDDNLRKVTIKVNKMKEIKMWLRMNMPKIRLIESSDNTVEEIEKELAEWREIYGIT